MPTDSERLAILETKTTAIEKTVARVDTNVDKIQISLSKQRGFIAGIMVVVAPVAALAVAFAKEAWAQLTS